MKISFQIDFNKVLVISHTSYKYLKKHIQISLTSYVGLMLHSTDVATTSGSRGYFEGTVKEGCKATAHAVAAEYPQRYCDL